MIATELRIGNLITVNNVIQQVCELPLPENCTNENTKPIPITEEWLLKFCFEKIVDNEFTLRYDLKKDPRFDYFLPKHNLKTFGLRFQGITLFDVVKSVHELQNLFFALKNKELTL